MQACDRACREVDIPARLPHVSFVYIQCLHKHSVTFLLESTCCPECLRSIRNIFFFFFANRPIRIKSYYIDLSCYNWSLRLFIGRPRLLLPLGTYCQPTVLFNTAGRKRWRKRSGKSINPKGNRSRRRTQQRRERKRWISQVRSGGSKVFLQSG